MRYFQEVESATSRLDPIEGFAVGVIAYEEGDLARDAVQSLLTGFPLISCIFLSDRSRAGSAFLSLKDLRSHSHLRLRHHPVENAIENFVDTGHWMLDECPGATGYALLAADDWWGPHTAAAFSDAVRVSSADMFMPKFIWTSESGDLGALRQPRLPFPSGFGAQFAWIASGTQAQPGNAIYALYRREMFNELLERISADYDRFEYAPDVNVAMNILAKASCLQVPNAHVHRRVPADEQGVVCQRLNLLRLNEDASKFRQRMRSLRIILLNSWFTSSALPKPWCLPPLRFGVFAWWLVLSISLTLRDAWLVSRRKHTG